MSEHNKRPGCCSDEELADYLANIFSGTEQDEGMASHVVECDSCFAKVADAVSSLKSFKENEHNAAKKVSSKQMKSLSRISSGDRGILIIMRRNKYLYIASGFFILSFILKGYFLQFLVAAVIFGLKWIMDTGGTKALIMIYDAWQHRKGSSLKDEDSLPNDRMKDYMPKDR